jgi:DNA-directed RNA polymerase specialized sigma24 family protein
MKFGVSGEEFGVQLGQCRSSLRLIAERVLAGAEEVEAAVQKCYDAASDQRCRFDSDGEFRAWLARIVLNEALMILQERQSGSEDTSEPIYTDGR